MWEYVYIYYNYKTEYVRFRSWARKTALKVQLNDVIGSPTTMPTAIPVLNMWEYVKFTIFMSLNMFESAAGRAKRRWKCSSTMWSARSQQCRRRLISTRSTFVRAGICQCPTFPTPLPRFPPCGQMTMTTMIRQVCVCLSVCASACPWWWWWLLVWCKFQKVLNGMRLPDIFFFWEYADPAM